MLGGLMGLPRLLERGGRDADDAPKGSHHTRSARRDGAIARANRRSRAALKRRHTPDVSAEIARSREPTGVLAQRYSVSTETIRKWRKRGPADCQDHSSCPHKLPWKATEEERAIVCALRRATGFPLDDLTFVV